MHSTVAFGNSKVTADSKCTGCGKTWGELGLPLECMHRYTERGKDGVIRCDFCQEPVGRPRRFWLDEQFTEEELKAIEETLVPGHIIPKDFHLTVARLIAEIRRLRGRS